MFKTNSGANALKMRQRKRYKVTQLSLFALTRCLSVSTFGSLISVGRKLSNTAKIKKSPP